MIKCAWASIDERGKAKGGKAGDQTGKEVKVGNWYDFGQNVILRPKSTSVANKIADNMKAIAGNKKVGYDQNNRLSLYSAWTAIKLSSSPAKINKKVETDCSAMVSACIISAGIRVNPACTTFNLRNACKNTGKFTVLTGATYTRTDAHLKKGDIILNERAHVIVALENGSKTKTTKTAKKKSKKPALPTLPKKGYLAKGDKGAQVKKLQVFLNWYGGYGLATDSSFGPATQKAVESFQKKTNLKVDGSFGPKSLAKAKKV